MNEKFYELSEEKQKNIINAALEVFASNDYKHALTDDIAAKAGISKGLLFYYFHNKQELYTYLFQYAKEFLVKIIVNEKYYSITDFFEILKYTATFKYQLFQKNPVLFQFLEKVIMSPDLDAGDDIRKFIMEYTKRVYGEYFSKIDYTKFRDGVDSKKIIQMMQWMAQGYLYELNLKGQKVKLDVLMKIFDEWIISFKRIAYKEEYQ